MSLRSRLALAMMTAAVLPMLVAVGVPLLRADARAREETAQRLDRARRQAELLVERTLRDARQRVEQAAADLGRDRPGQDRVLGGPEEPARGVARSLAERHGLEPVEIVGGTGRLLASSRPDARAGDRGELPEIAEGEAVVWSGASRPLVVARRSVPLASEPLILAGGAALGRDLVAAVAEFTGAPAALVDAGGRTVEEVGGAHPGPRVSESVPLGDSGWRLRVETEAGDAGRERRDLIASVAGIAPFALLTALAVGVFLAGRVSRPIRALADRADAIAVERSGFVLLDAPRDEVARLTRSFDRMLDALAGSEKQRVAAERIAAWQEVARRIAHEVKNPLSPIKLAVENLRRTREKAPAELDRALADETSTILEEVESLRRLVDEFSQFARLPAARPAPCDPRAVVRQAVGLFAQRIEAMGVHVEIRDEGSPERIEADAEQLGRAIKNVVANALDALEPVTDRKLAIAVRRFEGTREPLVEIEVSDSGVGLDPEAARRIFEPYFTTRADRGGTGLGMAIAYRIVSEHGGTIDAAGAPGRGTTITLRVPERGVLRDFR
jgi:signal transduction histidine kinase